MSLISDVGHLMPQQQNRCYVIKSNPMLHFYLFKDIEGSAVYVGQLSVNHCELLMLD